MTTPNVLPPGSCRDESAPAAAPTPADVDRCIDAGSRALRQVQDPAGWWKGELQTNVTMDAEDLLLRQFLGIRTAAQTERAARWIRAQQCDDGTWAVFHGGPPDLSTTVEAYVALRLAGDRPEADHMRRAARFVVEHGGIEASRVFTRIWLALFGLWPWETLPVLPPELLWLPPSVPLNVYDFGCWARQTVVALTVVGSHRPVRDLGVTVDELRTGAVTELKASLRTWAGRFVHLDRLLHRYERRPLRALRRLSLERAERWIIARQEADGCWGGIQPPWVYSLIALHLQGYALDHPVMAAGLAGLERFVIDDQQGRRLEACQSPVWDTALAVLALADTGADPDDEALERAGRWLAGEEITVPGDWQVRRPNLAPGGWAFEFDNDIYPDVDDTSVVAMALRRVEPVPEGPIERGLNWVLGMQCADGGWGAFDVDNVQTLCRELPFCDFGELIDPPSADVTAHVVELLAHTGRAPQALARGVQWLRAAQEPDGSWFGRWGVNYIYGTGAVVPALVAAGARPDDPVVAAALDWLVVHQNPDGGWGEDCRSYTDAAFRGRGTSTASQTAWALLALVAGGAAGTDGPAGTAAARGVQWLIDTQRADGTWDEPQFTGTGFPGDFYINYHLYRQVFPLMALGRYRSARATGGSPGQAHA